MNFVSTNIPIVADIETLHQLLEQQYEVAELYCNCLIELYNCTQSQRSKYDAVKSKTTRSSIGLATDSMSVLISAIRRYQTTSRKLARCHEAISSYLNQIDAIRTIPLRTMSETKLRSSDRLCTLLEEHLERSHRIFNTISSVGISFHGNGLQNVTANIYDSHSNFDSQFVVALSTLRVSIKNLRSVLSTYGQSM